MSYNAAEAGYIGWDVDFEAALPERRVGMGGDSHALAHVDLVLSSVIPAEQPGHGGLHHLPATLHLATLSSFKIHCDKSTTAKGFSNRTRLMAISECIKRSLECIS